MGSTVRASSSSSSASGSSVSPASTPDTYDSTATCRRGATVVAAGTDVIMPVAPGRVGAAGCPPWRSPVSAGPGLSRARSEEGLRPCGRLAGLGALGQDRRRRLAALADYADRYAPVAVRPGQLFVPAAPLEVVEVVTGNATTTSGRRRSCRSWTACRPRPPRRTASPASSTRPGPLDQVVAAAPPTLRKGPRGGGRDRDAVAKHCLAAEVAYARKLGVRHKEPDLVDIAAIAAYRADLLEVLRPARAGRARGREGLAPALRRTPDRVAHHGPRLGDRGQVGARVPTS